MNEDIIYPKGFNWYCYQCEKFHSVPDADLAHFVCPRCKGLGPIKKSLVGFKAVVVPKIEQPQIKEGPLRFKDTRFEVKLKDFNESKEEEEKKKPEIAGKTATKGAARKRTKQ